MISLSRRGLVAAIAATVVAAGGITAGVVHATRNGDSPPAAAAGTATTSSSATPPAAKKHHAGQHHTTTEAVKVTDVSNGSFHGVTSAGAAVSPAASDTVRVIGPDGKTEPLSNLTPGEVVVVSTSTHTAPAASPAAKPGAHGSGTRVTIRDTGFKTP